MKLPILNIRRLLCLIISLNVFIARADDETRNFRATGTALTVSGSFIQVSDDKYNGSSGWINGFSLISNKAVVELGLNVDKHIGHTYFKTEVTFDIQLTDAALNVQTYTAKQLEIYYDPAERSRYADKAQLIYSGYYKAKVYNVSFQTFDVNGNIISNFDLSDIYLQAEISTDKNYQFNLGVTSFAGNQYGTGFNSTNNELEIHWDYIKGANSYELEYTYLDDYDFSSTTFVSSAKSLSAINYDFRKDATKVLTPYNFFRIPLNYERGWMLYRLRPVFINASGIRTDGAWIPVGESGNLQTVAGTYPSLMYAVSAGFSQGISWTSTKQFSELGKTSTGIEYIDAMGLTRQSMARLSTEEKNIVQTTLYDHYARPRINIMPVPVNNLNFSYKQNLNKIMVSGSPVLFDKSIYDVCSSNNPCTNATFILDATNSDGAAKYYSSFNPNKNAQQGFIPDAKGLPYSEVKYAPDATGRILKESMPGSVHHTGAATGRAYQYFYSNPSQIELDRLFGKEAGAAAKYTKNFVVDPNGQTSTAYIDAYGRTVATALLGDEPLGLDPIPDKVSAVTLTEDLAVPSTNIKDTASKCIEVNTNFFVPGTNTQGTFDYSTTLGKFFPDLCTYGGVAPLCFDCVYDLEITIKDACGNDFFYDDDNNPTTLPVPVNISIGATPDASGKYTSNCITGEYSGTFPGTLIKTSLYEVSATPITIVFPKVGNYTIHKKICVSEKPIADYSKLYEDEEATCGTKYCDLFDSIIGGINFAQACSSASLSCGACLESISTYTNNPSNDPLSEEELNTLVGNCMIKCPLTTCEKMKRMLAYDFVPGGQFANLSNLDPNWGYSIFNVNNNLAASSGLGSSWSNPPNPGSLPHVYKNNLGTDATIILGGTTYYPENLSMAQFTANFQLSWAEALIPIHPEYCKTKFYCEVAGTSKDYDYNMLKLKHYSEACAGGYLKPFNFSYSYGPTCTGVTDPIFSVPFPQYNALINQLINDMTANYMGTGKNIYEVISEGVYNGSVPIGHVFGGDNCTKDREWQEFREAYLTLKDKLYDDMLTLYIQTFNPQGVGECASTLPNGYTTKFSDVNSLLNDDGIDPNWTAPPNQNQLNTAIGNNIAVQCSTECASYASLWDADLSSYCNGYLSLTQTQKNSILAAFEQICMLGCDANHPNGSSSSPTTPYILPSTSILCYDFQDVLDYYMPQFQSVSCSSYLISEPLPYNKSGSAPPAPPTLANDCKCDQLLKVQYDLANNINVPLGVTETWQLFQARYGYDLEEINAVLCTCNEAIHQQGLAQMPPNNSLIWSPAFTWNATGTGFLANNPTTVNSKLSCNTCARCDDVSVKMDALFTSLPNPASYTDIFNAMKFNAANQVYITNYLNINNDWNFSAGQYLELYGSCSQFTGTSTYSGLMNTQATELMTYLNSLVENGTFTTSHQMKLCSDSKFFLSSLYSDGLPVSSSNIYNYQVTMTTTNLQIQLKKNSSVICTINLTLPASVVWSDIKSVFYIVGYSPTPSPGAQYGFKLGCLDQNGATIMLTGNSSFVIGYLSNTTPYLPTLCPEEKKPNQSCQKLLIKDALFAAEQLYEQFKESTLGKFINEYKTACLDALDETFNRVYNLQEYHYTLFYYDEAGNLQRTVAPKGVTPLNITSNTPPTTLYPQHSAVNGVDNTYVSDYKFNTLGQVLQEKTVDGGETKYFYEKTGRLMASQNAKQAARSLANSTYIYSYILYDNVGRVTESGEIESTTPLTQIILDEPTTIPSNGAITFKVFCNNATKREVSEVFYDQQTINANILAKFSNSSQTNLRNRVAYTTYKGVSGANYKHGTYYSYDQHGNVSEVVQHNQDIESNYSVAASLKKISYAYDLISGNMNQITYQPGAEDQFMHKYYYDQDNRLHEVFSSKDGFIWDRDAKYFYYENSPLARVERADEQVQGTDYFYTIHSWIKGINSDILNPQNDAGKDAATGNAFNSSYNDLHAWFASDAVAYSLNYYQTGAEKDYEALNRGSYTTNGSLRNPLSDYSSITSGGTFNQVTDGPDLYNGNISSMVTSFIDKDPLNNDHPDNTAFPQLSGFKYDQLQRITASRTFRDISANSWNASTGANYDGSYAMQLAYDRNGNINFLKRAGMGSTIKSGSALAMDELNYSYAVQSTFGTKNSNQLIHIQDVAGGAYTEDLKAPSTAFASTPNYTYDEIGNLISDKVECIASTEWTLQRKVKKITRDPALLTAANITRSDLEFEYNSLGQRVIKIVKPRDPATKVLLPTKDWIYTYYIYDAGGNVMATYDRHSEPYSNGTQSPNLYKNSLSLSEHYLYGSTRLAVARQSLPYEWATYFINCGGNLGECQTPTLSLTTPQPTSSPVALVLNRNLGYKEFELSNHLGNVIATISDRKLQTWGNQVFNDDFSSSLNGWNNGSLSGGQLAVTATSQYYAANKTFNTTPGKTYRVRFNVTFPLGAVIGAEVYPVPVAPPFLVNITASNGYNEFSFTATTAQSVLRIQLASAPTVNYSIDDVIVDEMLVYAADMLTHTDYYPGGQIMPGRTWAGGDKYRYSHNGQEREDELFSGANSAEHWMFDSRVLRRWELDPLTYEWQSPYATFNNNPIFFTDPMGLEGQDVIKMVKDENGNWVEGSRVVDKNNFDVYEFEGVSDRYIFNKDLKFWYWESKGPPPELGATGTSQAFIGTPAIAGLGTTGTGVQTAVGTGGAVANGIAALGAVGTVYAAYKVYNAAANWTEGDLMSVMNTGKTLDERTDLDPEPKKSDDNKITLYRGVNPTHPDYKNALKGTATPLGGSANPRKHNEGTTLSIFTSWTTDRQVASQWATIMGAGGVVLEKEFNPSTLVPSPDIYNEKEVLVPGVVTGARVTKPGKK